MKKELTLEQKELILKLQRETGATMDSCGLWLDYMNFDYDTAKKVITDLIKQKKCKSESNNVTIINADNLTDLNVKEASKRVNKFVEACLFTEEEMRGETHTPTIYISHSQTINNTPYLNAIIKIVSILFTKNYRILTPADYNLSDCINTADIVVGLPLFDNKLPYNVACDLSLGLQEKKAVYKINTNDFSLVRCMDEDTQILNCALNLGQHKYAIEHNIM